MVRDITVVSELHAVVKEIIKEAGKEHIWLLQGEMGAGKTTLVKAICAKLGVIDEVSSPTFSIINEYETNTGKSIYHFDFFRIKSEVEAENLGLDEYFYSGDLCLIEWPENITRLIPNQYLKINIKFIAKKRTIHLTKHGPDKGD